MKKDKTKLLQRFRRIEGQIRGLQRMIENERPCEEIIAQFASINGALKSAGFLIVMHYINECLMRKADSVENLEKEIEKIIKTYISSM
ncbi:MAG: metal-sensitive transcriptional regulator [Thermodesulfovibrio sp.]|nr:metal-sensitive transcriptional regulator [Thermodesulfovibrio sp.]MCX7725012.1 metal-sensitive transcriptional regulator [Thermodesulfovibrio sp.]MDW7972371.1 metal-sensitive transcriptional regulator [Thermodesulfovibrio sp.]